MKILHLAEIDRVCIRRIATIVRSSILELGSRTWAWCEHQGTCRREGYVWVPSPCCAWNMHGSKLSFQRRLRNARLPRRSRFILWICDAVAPRYLRGRPLIFTAIPNMLAHAEPILEENAWWIVREAKMWRISAVWWYTLNSSLALRDAVW